AVGSGGRRNALVVGDLPQRHLTAKVVVIDNPALAQIPDSQVVRQFVIATAMLGKATLLLPLPDLFFHGLKDHALRRVHVDPDQWSVGETLQGRMLEVVQKL